MTYEYQETLSGRKRARTKSPSGVRELPGRSITRIIPTMGLIGHVRGVVLVAVVVITACMPRPHAADYAVGLVIADPVPGAPSTADNVDTSTQMTLADAFRLALARSEQVSIANDKVNETEIESDATWNDVTPNISAYGTAALQMEKDTPTATPVVLQPGDELTVGARLLQPLFRRGFYASRTAGALGHESARASLARAHERLAREVTQAFVDVLLSRRLRDLAQASVERTEKQLDHATARVKAGQVLRNAELLASLDLKRAQRQLVTAQRDVGIAETEFRVLIGRPPPANLVLPPAPAIPNQKDALALAGHRTDLRALQLNLSQAQAAEEAVRDRQWWPRVDLLAFVQGNEPEVLALKGKDGTGNRLDWQVLGLVTIPLLQSGREYTDLSLQENKTHVAALALQQELKAAGEEVEVTDLRRSSADRVVEFADQQLTVARDHYNLVDNQFRLGAVTFLEVTNAQAVLVEAENALAVAEMDQVRALYDFLFAIGALDLDRQSPKVAGTAP